ncbi:TPA: PTS sugar transporter subunit IIA [Photobacterium damselae]
MAISQHILFYCGEGGLPLYQLNRLKKLADYFRSSMSLVNVTLNKSANIDQPLRVLALATKPQDLCLFHIEGLDAELAHRVVLNFLAEYQHPFFAKQRTTEQALDIVEDKRQQYCDWLHFDDNQMIKANFNTHPPTKTAVLETLAQTIALDNRQMGLQAITQAFQNREQISATVMNHHIALPHIMNEQIEQPSLAVYLSNLPIDWHSPRGPVSLIIALALPKPATREMIMPFALFSKSLLESTYCQGLLSVTDTAEFRAMIVEGMSTRT